MAERDRWPLFLPVGFAIGIGLYFALPVEPPPFLGLFLVAMGAVVGGVIWVGAWQGARQRSLAWAPALLALVAASLMVAAGFAAAQWRNAEVAAPLLTDRHGPALVSGRIISVSPLAGGKSLRVVLAAPRVEGLAPAATPRRLRLRLPFPPSGPPLGTSTELHPGQGLQVRAMLRPPPPPVAPGAFDFQRHAWFQEIGAVGYGVTRPLPLEMGDDRFRPAASLSSLRQQLQGRIMAAVEGAPGLFGAPLPSATGAVAAALMVGERGPIPEAGLEAMRIAGLAHLLAISGLHMGLVSGLLFFALRAALALVPALALRYPIKKWAAAGAILGGLGYLLISGATVPTQRAFTMTSLVFLAVILDRQAISLFVVAWAALLVLALAPESLLGPSFQMSFAAVVALVAVYETLGRRLSKQRHLAWERPSPGRRRLGRLGLYFGGVALTTLVAGLATAPFAAYHFNRFAVYGLMANLMAVPLTALWVMPWAIIAFFLMPLGAEVLALVPMGWGVDLVLRIASWVAAWPGAVGYVPALPVAALVVFALGGVWLAVWQGRWRFLGVGAVALSLGLAIQAVPPDILVAEDARLVGIRDDQGGLYLSSLRRGRFTAEIWRRRWGRETARPFPPAGGYEAAGLACDALGCVYDTGESGTGDSAGGTRTAFAWTAAALVEDCRMADAVISLVPARRPCAVPGPLIDRFDLWRHGAHALWLPQSGAEKAGYRLSHVAAFQGKRPWAGWWRRLQARATSFETDD